MNARALFNLFVVTKNPSIVHDGGIYEGDSPVDCAIISEYSSPEELLRCISSVLHSVSKGCHIFIPVCVECSLGSPIPYPVVVSNIISAYAVDISMSVLNSLGSSTVVLVTHGSMYNIDHSMLSTFDFSKFNSCPISHGIMDRYGIIPWQSSALTQSVLNTQQESTDIVFTLADADSPTDNEELRIALRSIDKNAQNVGNIWVVTGNPPSWLTGVNIVESFDDIPDNKDANLINKVRSACAIPDLSDKFIYWSDDQVLTGSISLNDVFPIYNSRGLSEFSHCSNKWHRRMRNTLELIKKHNGDASINWDSHVPQPINKNLFEAIMSNVDYSTLPGLCINTTYFGILGERPRWPQSEFKRTYESVGIDKCIMDRLFLGYNDKGFNSGVKQELIKEFSKNSKYEKK